MTRPQRAAGPGRWWGLLLMSWLGASLVGWVATAQEPAAPAPTAPAPTALQLAQAMQDVLAAAIAKAEPSVVAIARVRRGTDRRVREPLGGTSGDPGPDSPDFVPNEFATGVVVDRRGLILTNYHVLGDLEQNDYYVWVNRAPFKVAKVQHAKAADPWMDLAVLQIAADNLQPIQLGDASQLKKGQIVIALGNPYAVARDGEVSATWGIISNLARQAPRSARRSDNPLGKETLHHYGTLIQTDAKLTLGTSGGALLNLKGEMIGLTTAFAARVGYEQAAGYAIPVDEHFKETLKQLKAGRKAEYGFLGVAPWPRSLMERQEGRLGALVGSVVYGTPASRAGLQANDIITHVNQNVVYDDSSLIRHLSSLPAGTRVDLTIERSSGRRTQWSRSVVLSKKFMNTLRPPYSETGDPSWRGMRVEYATAMPKFHLQSRLTDPLGCVGVLQVEPDSPAWKAGLRAGTYISHVESTRVDSPQQFYSAVDSRQGPVRVHSTFAQGGQVHTIHP